MNFVIFVLGNMNCWTKPLMSNSDNYHEQYQPKKLHQIEANKTCRGLSNDYPVKGRIERNYLFLVVDNLGDV